MRRSIMLRICSHHTCTLPLHAGQQAGAWALFDGERFVALRSLAARSVVAHRASFYAWARHLSDMRPLGEKNRGVLSRVLNVRSIRSRIR